MKWLWDKIRPSGQEATEWDHFQQMRLNKMAVQEEGHRQRVDALLASSEFTTWADQRQGLLPIEEVDDLIARLSSQGLPLERRDVLKALEAYEQK